MNIAQEILKLKHQVLKPNISTEEFRRIQIEIGKLKSLEMEVQPIPVPATEVLEVGEKDLQNEKEVVEVAVCQRDTQTGVINNQRRAELMQGYIKELEEVLNPLLVRADELIKEEEAQAELGHVEPRTLYDLDSKLSERIVKLKRQVAGYEKRIKECLENPHWV